MAATRNLRKLPGPALSAARAISVWFGALICGSFAYASVRLAQVGYAVSQRIRKRIEEAFGWIKKPVGLAKTKLRGRTKVEAVVAFAAAAYNFVRIPKLLTAQATWAACRGRTRPSAPNFSAPPPFISSVDAKTVAFASFSAAY